MHVSRANRNRVRAVAGAVNTTVSQTVDWRSIRVLSDDFFSPSAVAGADHDYDVREHGSFDCFANRIEMKRFFRRRAEAHVRNANAVAIAILNYPVQSGDDVANAACAGVVQDSNVNQVRSWS